MRSLSSGLLLWMVAQLNPFLLGVRRFRFPPRLPCQLPRCFQGLVRCWNFLPSQRPPPILCLEVSVTLFAHHQLVLRRGALALRIQLQPPILVQYHPVVADPGLALQSENLGLLGRMGRATMVVLRLARRQCTMTICSARYSVSRYVFATSWLVIA